MYSKNRPFLVQLSVFCPFDVETLHEHETLCIIALNC